MGRDLTGVIVLAKTEKEAYKKARKIFKKLVKEEALWYFLTRDDDDDGTPVSTYSHMKNLERAMLVDKTKQSKGYRFIQKVITMDQAYDSKVERLIELINALSSIKTKEQAKKFLVAGKLTYVNASGKRETKDFLKIWMADIGDNDKYVTGIYAQYWGKITSYRYLDWVTGRDPEDFKDSPKIAKKMKNPEYKLWVIPALSKT